MNWTVINLALFVFFISLSKCVVADTGTAIPQPGNKAVSSGVTKPENYLKVILLPVNEAKTQFAQLTIPKNFKLGHSQQAEQGPGLRQMILEFIPQGEKIENWSRIITAQSFVGQKFQAQPYLDLAIANIREVVGQANMSKPQVLYAVRDGYQEGSAKLSYTNQGVKEVLLIRIFSGPYDTAVMQMTYRPGTSDAAEEKLYEKSFLDSVKLTLTEELPPEMRENLSKAP